MGTGKVVKFVFSFFAKLLAIPLLGSILSFNLFCQSGYIESQHSVYRFFESLYAADKIKNYDLFTKPKAKSEVVKLLKVLIADKEKLNDYEKEFLNYFVNEFYFDIYGSLANIAALNLQNYSFDTNKKRFLFAYDQPDRFNLFVNLYGGFENYYMDISSESKNSGLSRAFVAGGEVMGTFYDKVGFFMNATNGIYSGNRMLLMHLPKFKYNFKINETEDEKFFDNSFGYLYLDFDNIKLKLGNDFKEIGYNNFYLFNDSQFGFNNIDLSLDYKFFRYNFFLGKLLGPKTTYFDSTMGSINYVAEKHIVYHRIGFDIFSRLSLGFGEMVVYSNRGFDLSYLNPFTFYKTLEHNNQDRDNAFLFFDFNLNLPFNSLINGLYLIDDINMSKGGEWWGNQTLLNLNASIYKVGSSPFDIHLGIVRISPYTFTHRILGNNFTNQTYLLSGDFFLPNSMSYIFGLNFEMNPKFNVGFNCNYMVHGANFVGADGKIVNVGGDFLLGHRVNDDVKSKFLDGNQEIFRYLSIFVNYELLKNVIFVMDFYYQNADVYDVVLNKTQNSKKFYIVSNFNIKL